MNVPDEVPSSVKEEKKVKAEKNSPETTCISLLDSDDDMGGPLAPPVKRFKTSFDAKLNREVIDLDSDSDDNNDGNVVDDDGDAKMAPAEHATNNTDEIEIVQRQELPEIAPEEIKAAARSSGANGASASNDEDLKMIGVQNENRSNAFPHARQDCTECGFVLDMLSMFRTFHGRAEKPKQYKEGLECNKKSCKLCYCYVCDKPSSECDSWFPTDGASPSSTNAHCFASDKGSDSKTWKQLRELHKMSSSRTTASVFDPFADLFPELALHRPTKPDIVSPVRSGPFPPDDGTAASSSNCTKCSKCGWYSRLKKFDNEFVTSCSQWCHACGRLPKPVTFEHQGESYQPIEGDVLLGKKELGFTIKPRDPRKIDAYKKNWEENEWQYNESDMMEEAFKQRFRKFVKPYEILKFVPITKNLPEDGEFPRESGASTFDGPHDVDTSVSELDSVILNNLVDKFLLEELNNYTSFGKRKDANQSGQIAGHIKASWSKEGKRGVFTVTVYLRNRDRRGTNRSANLSRLLGCWFNIFPFALADLVRGLEAKESTRRLAGVFSAARVPVPPFTRMNSGEEEEEVEEVQDEVDVVVDLFKGAQKEQLDESQTLVSSSGFSCVGGTCASEPGTLAQTLLYYFRDMLAEDIVENDFIFAHSWIGQKKYKLTSAHRWMRDSEGSTQKDLLKIVKHRQRRYNGQVETVYLNYNSEQRDTYFESYLPVQEYPIACENLYESARFLLGNCDTMQGLLEHFENVGHQMQPFCEGLNVQLLPFQRHSVKWAIERETYGLNAFLWKKLEGVKAPPHGDDVYFNPVLDRISPKKPSLCRGGLICEQMGLGKTIISLALILERPAPAFPPTGSAVSTLDSMLVDGAETETEIGWDPDTKPMPEDKPKKASILSHGTLVICPVSLVGQWITEAKNRLKDPGLLHAYHGGNRKRDPKVLSKYSIVVTTYAVLASDATYWAKKSGSEDYVPPCEQIRWWRVICDESHVMRQTSTRQTFSATSIVADHKWCVTGTPFSTSLQDLLGQLKYIGLDDATDYFSVFKSTTMSYINDPSQSTSGRRRRHSYESNAHRSGNDRRLIGHLAFFMRNIMMRHSIDQRYKGSNTKLMSLPGKQERTIEVDFNADEVKEYEELESIAKRAYLSLKMASRKTLSSHYLKLSQMLRPLRVACAGGHVPIDDDGPNPKGDDDGNRGVLDDEDSDGDDNDDEAKPKGRRKEQKFSDFCFKSKLRTLITELERIRREEPKSKTLVFSQYTSTLKWLQEELPKHGFEFRTLQSKMSMKKRAKALDDFQNDPPTTIFLLSMRSSNCGINLTIANRVFLMEPTLNPATEKQAIGRVVRLGQKRKVEIVHLVMKDSVEERIRDMLETKYGSKEKEKEQTDKDEDETGGQVKAYAAGSLISEKCEMVTREFDLLFGLPAEEEEESETAGSSGNDGDGLNSGFASLPFAPKTEKPDSDDKDDDDYDSVSLSEILFGRYC